LPFPTQTIEFKTYARENIGIKVHIHQFKPLLEEGIPIRPKKEPEKIPQKLLQVVEVAGLVFKGEELKKAFKKVAKQHGITESSVRDKCTRQLDIDTEKFKELVQNKNRFIAFLKDKYPQHENLINEKLA